MNKQNLKHAVGVYGVSIIAFLMCFILYMSISLIFTGLGTEVIGYTTYETVDGGKPEVISNYEFAAGEDKTIPEAADNQTIISDYSKLPLLAAILQNVISQLFMALLFAVLMFYKLGSVGKRDGDDFRFNKKPIDKNRGLKIGLIAAIPSAIVYLVLIVSKLISYNFFVLYRIINIPFRPIVDLICGNAQSISEAHFLSIFALIIIVFAMPAICAGTYRLGFNDEAIFKKLVYKKKK